MANNVYFLDPPRPGSPSKMGEGLSGGSGGSTFDPMEARVARLEEDMREIKADLKALREEMRLGFKDLGDKIHALTVESAEIKGRLTQIPTIWQVVTLVFGVMVGVFGILKYGLH